jgi:ribonuclease BN (tRNA processing enzyme)
MKLYKRELDQIAREREDYRALISRIRDDSHLARRPGFELTCIGNAGGADNLVHGRPAGGFLLRYRGRTMVIDPGDSCLAFLVDLGLDLYTVTDVLASHSHNDHVGDLSALISAAVRLGLRDASNSHILVCPSLVDYSSATSTRFGFTLPTYAWKGDVHALYWEPATATRYDGATVTAEPTVTIDGDIVVSATESRHGQVKVTGFMIDTPYGRLGYTSDTEYFPGLANWYKDVDVLWMNMNTLAVDTIDDFKNGSLRNYTIPVHSHLGYVGVCSLIEEVRPKTAIVSHLGAQLLSHRPTVQDLLQERFAGKGITIYCPVNGESYFFEHSLSEPPSIRDFIP